MLIMTIEEKKGQRRYCANFIELASARECRSHEEVDFNFLGFKSQRL